jgi:(E)-4-hydroxy-3-methylbut-2-enyl-diphosphate synthase
VTVGGLAAPTIQSMTRTATADIEATAAQIRQMAVWGCDLVRVAVRDERAAAAVPAIVQESPLPVVADIHFSSALAMACLAGGAAGVRLNPLALDAQHSIEAIGAAAARHGAAIRVGINSARLPIAVPESEAGQLLVERVLETVHRLECGGLEHIKVSVKSSHVAQFIAANRLLAEQCGWPIHLGLTEAGFGTAAVSRSAGALAVLLNEGIGDTIRFSLCGDPHGEIVAARALLGALGLRSAGVELIACPGCGRAHGDVGAAAETVQRGLADLTVDMQVAVMGCEVNGPGEARRAEMGIAATPQGWVLFCRGRTVRRLSFAEGPEVLVAEARKRAAEIADAPKGAGGKEQQTVDRP